MEAPFQFLSPTFRVMAFRTRPTNAELTKLALADLLLMDMIRVSRVEEWKNSRDKRPSRQLALSPGPNYQPAHGSAFHHLFLEPLESVQHISMLKLGRKLVADGWTAPFPELDKRIIRKDLKEAGILTYAFFGLIRKQTPGLNRIREARLALRKAGKRLKPAAGKSPDEALQTIMGLGPMLQFCPGWDYRDLYEVWRTQKPELSAPDLISGDSTKQAFANWPELKAPPDLSKGKYLGSLIRNWEKMSGVSEEKDLLKYLPDIPI